MKEITIESNIEVTPKQLEILINLLNALKEKEDKKNDNIKSS